MSVNDAGQLTVFSLGLEVTNFFWKSLDALVAFNFSFEDLPNYSVGKNWPAHRNLCTRLSIEQLLDVQFESGLGNFFQFENWKHCLSPVIPYLIYHTAYNAEKLSISYADDTETVQKLIIRFVDQEVDIIKLVFTTCTLNRSRPSNFF